MRKGWEYKKLGDCTQILDSQRKPVTKRDRKSGIYPYYGATGIQDYVDKYILMDATSLWVKMVQSGPPLPKVLLL